LTLTAEEKEKLLRALEEDREFRYAMMGLLGFKEVLDRITKLEEGHREILERIAKIEERQQKLEERLLRVEEELVRLRRLWEVSRRDIGALTEVLYTRVVWEYLRDELGERGEKVLRKRRNAVVEGIEVDMLVETDRTYYAVEVKVQPSHHDVREVASKAAELKRKLGKEVVPVLAGTWVGSELRQLADRYGVRIVEY